MSSGDDRVGGGHTPTYGDFPDLFEDFPSAEPVDLQDIRTWSRVMSRADEAAFRRLYPRKGYEARAARSAGAKRESWELVRRLGLGDPPAED